MNTLYIYFLIMILITGFRGYRRGLYAFIYGAITWIAIISLLPTVAARVSDKLMDNDKYNEKIEETVEPYVDVLSLDVIDYTLEGLASDPELIKNYFQNFMGTEEYLEEYEKMVLGEPYDEDVVNRATDSLQAAGFTMPEEDINLSDEVRKETKDSLIRNITYAISMAMGYLLIKIVIILFGMILMSFMDKRSRSSIDVLGLIWGLCEGVLYIYVAFMIISFVDQIGFGKLFLDQITQSSILNHLYENNIIAQLLKLR